MYLDFLNKSYINLLKSFVESYQKNEFFVDFYKYVNKLNRNSLTKNNNFIMI
jgi:hypothetical protein